jgi:hypothetical protein
MSEMLRICAAELRALIAARPQSDLEQRLRELAATWANSGATLHETFLEAADDLAKRDYQMRTAASRIADLERELAQRTQDLFNTGARLGDLERELAEYKLAPTCTPEVRWHARHRGKLDGADAQALEGALSQCERELASTNEAFRVYKYATEQLEKVHERELDETRRQHEGVVRMNRECIADREQWIDKAQGWFERAQGAEARPDAVRDALAWVRKQARLALRDSCFAESNTVNQCADRIEKALATPAHPNDDLPFAVLPESEADVCGKRCAHDSECLLLKGHEPADKHETQHGCIFYDLRDLEEAKEPSQVSIVEDMRDLEEATRQPWGEEARRQQLERISPTPRIVEDEEP